MATLALRGVETSRQVRRGACRPLVFLWLLAIGQYAYRYVLQVNDTRTSLSYGATPVALSALKYELLAGFAGYVLFRLWRRRWRVRLPGKKLRTALWGMGAALLGFAVLIALRLVDSAGELDRETWVCIAELIPWMATVFLVPPILRPQHGVAETLRVFERVSFWVAWPFWMMTVALAVFDVRYPALSHPGILLRFGGVLDDPNGYACLCLLWLVLCLRERTGHWKWRAMWYLVMLFGTVSLAGYGMGVVMGACLLLGRLFVRRTGRPRSLGFRFVVRIGMAGLLIACVVLLLGTIYNTEEAVDNLSRIVEAKSTSAATHVDQLTPDMDWFHGWSWMEVVFGRGGFSENFYWRVLLNFGVVGLAAVVMAVLVWFYQALWKTRTWRSSLGIWGAGTLVASNGIAYLLVFPVSLLCWSVLALVMYGDGTESTYAKSP